MDESDLPTGGDLEETFTWRERDILSLLAERRTNREIAQALGLELTTVKWYNRQIFSKLGVDSRYQAVAKAQEYGLLDEPRGAPSADVRTFRQSLPVQVTSFVGREREIGDVRRLLQEVRLLTLTGPAGAGKTRLAIQAAAEPAKANAFEDGVYFVNLAPVGNSEHVASAIASELGIKEVPRVPITERVVNYLGSMHMLLILDNFEHVLQSSPLVVDLLAAAPALRILVTSREALNVYGEQDYPVPPLTLPSLEQAGSLAELSESESVALFFQRARAVRPDFVITDGNARAVMEICIRLDGLPLAIELAAARVRMFGPEALLAQMEERFRILEGGPLGLPDRQRTLRGAVEWSYDLLDDAEKTLFSRLSAFNGGRSIEAVEAVCGHGLAIDVLDGLESLLRKNLLRQVEGPDGEPRFVMLETIHEYGRLQLQGSGEAEDIYRRHADFFTSLAERAEPRTRGGGNQMRWLRRLEADHDNLRTALAWSLGGGDVELGLRLVGALGFFWFRQGHYAEGQSWTARALDMMAERDVPPAVQSSLYFAAGVVSMYLGEREQGKRMFAEALARYEQLEAERELGWTLILLSYLSAGQPENFQLAVTQCEEGLVHLRSLDDKAGVAQGLNNLGELMRSHGDLPQAREAYNESLAIAREIGDRLRESLLIMALGQTAHREGDTEEALALLQEGLTAALEIGNRVAAANILPGLAGVALELGQAERAARLLGAAEASYEKYGFNPLLSDLPEYHRFSASARERLDEQTFEAAWAEGYQLSLEEAVAYAMKLRVTDR